MSATPAIRLIAIFVAFAIALTLLADVSVASAQGGAWWQLNATVAPTLLPREGQGVIVLTATNLGYGEVDGGEEQVTISDRLPAGVTPVSASATCGIAGQLVTCTWSRTLTPYQRLEGQIVVATHDPVGKPPMSVVHVSGGHTPEATLEKPLGLVAREGEATPFGVETYELMPEDEHGASDALAGGHPFQLTTVLDFNESLEEHPGEAGTPGVAALPRDLDVTLPSGLIGDPTAVARCSITEFTTLTTGEGSNLCPTESAVGVTVVLAYNPKLRQVQQLDAPVFNLEPAPGEPARLGFVVDTVPIILQTAVPSGGDYAVHVGLRDISQAVQVLSSIVTLWGIPGDIRHASSRGLACLERTNACESTPETNPKAFLTLPTSCEVLQQAQQSTIAGDSWPAPPNLPGEAFGPRSSDTPFPRMSGCPLAFEPSLALTTETQAASTPAGVESTLEMNQSGLLDPEGRAESAVRNTTVTLPAGLEVNPSSANGLAACSLGAIGYEGRNEQTGVLEFEPEPARQLSAGEQEQLEGKGRLCPKASKLGTVEVETPLLAEPLRGGVYIAQPAPNEEGGRNPFNSLLALYVVAENPNLGVLVKLAGEGRIDEANGQITAVFDGTPQVPFHRLRLHFFGREQEGPGEGRQALSTPAFCGSGYQAAGVFDGWSEGSSLTLLTQPFAVLTGPTGGSCPSGSLPFAPTLRAGSSSAQAGAFSGFSLDLSRGDGQQQLTGISIHMPPGLAGVLASLTACREPPPEVQWSCGADSLIGHTLALAGVGGEPVALPGSAYLTTGYDGAPFGVLVQTPAVAGPFDLGIVDVRSRIDVDPGDASATIATDPGPHHDALPTRLRGIPAQLKEVRVDVDRAQFLFNPTDCDTLQIQATLTGAEGAHTTTNQPFQAQNCASLPFHPVLQAFAASKGSKTGGTALTVRVTSQGLGVANIHKVDLQLPKQLPSRLSTIQKACSANTFQTDPASCPEGSVIGSATIHTPILKNPLTGPAYLVSHGNTAFPNVEFVLQGEGLKIVLDGHTDIKKGITYSRFETAPDAPFTTFETILPAGPHSALTANVTEAKHYDLCGEKLTMPTTIVAQDGATVNQPTKIALQGCAQVKGLKAKKLTLAQRLNKALAQCHKRYRHSKARRITCEQAAHARYTAQAQVVCRRTHRHATSKRRACEQAARRRYALRPHP